MYFQRNLKGNSYGILWDWINSECNLKEIVKSSHSQVLRNTVISMKSFRRVLQWNPKGHWVGGPMWWLEEVMPRSLPRRGVAPETHHQVSPLRAGIPIRGLPPEWDEPVSRRLKFERDCARGSSLWAPRAQRRRRAWQHRTREHLWNAVDRCTVTKATK